MQQCLLELADVNTIRDVKKFGIAVMDRFSRIEIDESKDPLRVGLIGEVSVLRDELEDVPVVVEN